MGNEGRGNGTAERSKEESGADEVIVDESTDD